MKQFTTEDLPNILEKLHRKIRKIKKLIREEKKGNCGNRNDLLTINEASKLLNLSVSTIYTKVSKNEIPVNKQGKRLYFYRSELLEWIKSGRIKTVDEIRKEIDIKFNNNHYFK